MKHLVSIQRIMFGAVVWGCAHSAAAQQPAADDATRATARQLGEQGIQAFWANDFVSADEKLDKAYRLYPTPTLGLWSARARAKRDHWVEAAERYREAARPSDVVGDAAAQKQAQKDATKELNELSPTIPSLTIQLEGAEPSEVTVTIDGVAVPAALIDASRPTNPGKHRVVAVRRDERNESELTLVEKDRKTVAFEFKAQAPSPTAPAAATTTPAEAPAAASAPAPPAATTERASSVLVPIGIGAVAISAASLVTSGVTALVANGKRDACPDNTCTKSSDKDAYDSVKTIATVTFYVGAVLAAAGLTSWIIGANQNSESDRAVSFELAPTGAAIRGAF